MYLGKNQTLNFKCTQNRVLSLKETGNVKQNIEIEFDVAAHRTPNDHLHLCRTTQHQMTKARSYLISP